MVIEFAKSALLQPLDRAYKQKGMRRIEHLEIMENGIAHALRTGGQLLVILRLTDVANGTNDKD